jgi:hypothetical protein
MAARIAERIVRKRTGQATRSGPGNRDLSLRLFQQVDMAKSLPRSIFPGHASWLL